MLKGFVSGLFWGLLAAAGAFVGASVLAPLPERFGTDPVSEQAATTPEPVSSELAPPPAVEAPTPEQLEEDALVGVVEEANPAAQPSLGQDTAGQDMATPDVLREGKIGHVGDEADASLDDAPASEEVVAAPDLGVIPSPEVEAELELEAAEPEVARAEDAPLTDVETDLAAAPTTAEEGVEAAGAAPDASLEAAPSESPDAEAAPDLALTTPPQIGGGESALIAPSRPDDAKDIWSRPRVFDTPPSTEAPSLPNVAQDLPAVLPTPLPDAAAVPEAAPSEPALSEPAPSEEAEVRVTVPSNRALIAPSSLPQVGVERPAGTASTEPSQAPAQAGNGVQTGRLPQLGTEAPADVTEEIVGNLDQALLRNARPFVNPDRKPPFVILLRDTENPEVDLAALAASQLPMTLVIDPASPNAAERAALWRAAGQEVALSSAALPAGGAASDIEIALEALGASLPQALAVVDLGSTALDRAAASALVPGLQTRGFGLVTWDSGVNPADQVARREGLPSTRIFRDLDAKDEAAPVIRRYLDRAAFKAQQEGHVLVIGSLRPETLAAVHEWSLEGRVSGLALAPLSGALLLGR